MYKIVRIKWIKICNISPNVIRFIQKIVGQNYDIEVKDEMSGVNQADTKIYKWDYIKFRRFWTSNKSIIKILSIDESIMTRIKGFPQNWKTIRPVFIR